MENSIINCTSCEKPLPSTGFFCGYCMTQFKCKVCNHVLEQSYLGCTNCGAPKASLNQQSPNNTFKLHETASDRIIEATFSDNVGKDLAQILKDSYSTKLPIANTNNKILNPEVFEDVNIGVEFEDETLVESQQESAKAQIENSSVLKYPTLMDIAVKNLPQSAVEWIIIFSLYASNFGKATFTRAQIIERHIESKRKQDSFQTNLSRDLTRAIQAGYINQLHDGYFLIEEGVVKGKEIASRLKGSIPKSAKRNTSSNSKGDEIKPAKNKQVNIDVKSLPGIDFHPKGKDSLIVYFKKFLTKNDYEKILVFVSYLQDIINEEKISYNHIYTCFDTLNLRIPENLPQTIRDSRSRKKWIEGRNNALIQTVKGRNKIKFWDE